MSDNILAKIGDSLSLNIVSQINGKIRINSYNDSLDGLTSERNVSRQFRITEDNIFWDDWLPLTNDNLSADEYDPSDMFIIQVKYTRIGTDDSGVIKFNEIQFDGDRVESPFLAPTISNSIFSRVVNTLSHKNLENNLFKKLYYRGIVPNYITRAENRNKKEDEAYITLFSTVASFFALLITFFKRFENFKEDYDLMFEQVRQHGLYLDESNVSITDLQYLSSSLYDEIRKRGTELVLRRRNYELSDGSYLYVDGEALRVLKNYSSDELVYENVPMNKIGWCLGNTSPMYRGTSQAVELNKTKENSKDFNNIDNFIVSGSSCSLKTIDNKKVLNLKPQGGYCGLGRIEDDIELDYNKIYTAESKLDYEITFMFKKTSSVSSTKLKFGVEGFDQLKNKLTDAFITTNGNSISNVFFEIPLNNFRNDVWYQVRGIIHAYSSINTEEVLTNIGYGSDLHFNNSFVKFILPKIQLYGSSGSEINIWDYKIRPLVRGTNILPLKNGYENSTSLGFIQSGRLFYCYAKNNNNNRSKSEVTNIIDKYLLPYGSTNILTLIK